MSLLLLLSLCASFGILSYDSQILISPRRMLYNFPAVTGGIDMDSDVIAEIAKRAPNTCGVKLTYVFPP